MKKSRIVIAVVLLASVSWYFLHSKETPNDKSRKGNGVVPVATATAKTGDIAIYATGLGNITPRNIATVRSRVDGQVMRVAFTEGQYVKEGDLLIELDARPFEAQLKQAEGQMLKDNALLSEARLNLQRYQTLYKQDSVAKQQLDSQQSLVKQYQGAVENDQGLVDNAKLQVSYAHITAPFNGQVGLRQIDTGNIVHTGDTSGVVILTQLQPITAVFTLPEDMIPTVMQQIVKKEPIIAEAFDRDNKQKIATGYLLAIDNQIDQTTGTVKLKAEFANEDNALFPSQFVNIRCKIDTRHNATLIPVAAVQKGADGSFVYRVKEDSTVTVQPVTIDVKEGENVAITKGIKTGDIVVIDGLDNLREGAKIEVPAPAKEGEAKEGTTKPDAGAEPGKEKKHKKH